MNPYIKTIGRSRSFFAIGLKRSTELWFLLSASILLVGCGSRSGKNSDSAQAHSTNRAMSKAAPEYSGANRISVGSSAIDSETVEPYQAKEPKEYQDASMTNDNVMRYYRRNDDRPIHDDAKLASFGIRKYTSQRLIIYTDSNADDIRNIPAVVDQAYKSLVNYFGPAVPSRDGSDFQMTGYIIQDRLLFSKLGLVPEAFAGFVHGKHDGYRFWMKDQEADYYRRHLAIHEATHCFMTIVRNRQPVWYLEGMAEFFAVHRQGTDGEIEFGVAPKFVGEFPGFGRIQTIRAAFADGRAKSIAEIIALRANDFAKSKEPYAWAWALCQFLDSHPRYQKAFRSLRNKTEYNDFLETFDSKFGQFASELQFEWELICTEIAPGYDFARNAVDFNIKESKMLNAGDSATFEIDARQGWQSTGLIVDGQADYGISVSGTIVLGSKPVPWESTAAGISIRFANGKPIGQLQAILYRAPEVDAGRSMVPPPVSIGEGGRYRFKNTGMLLLRINDEGSSRSDNGSHYSVQVVKLPTKE